MEIISMDASQEKEIRALYQACHPGWPSPPEWHFFAYPTLIAVENERLAGYTSYSMNISDHGDLYVLNSDVGVAEWARNRGVGGALNWRRVEIGYEMGAKCVVGMTQPDNTSMLKIFRAQGFEKLLSIRHAYPGRDGVVYVRNLRGMVGWKEAPRSLLSLASPIPIPK